MALGPGPVLGERRGVAGLLHKAWQRRINTPQSSAAGRLFDGAAALLGLCSHASFEGQGPMLLEAVASPAATPIELPITRTPHGLLEIDWQPLLPMLLDERMTPAQRAGVFHASLAQALVNSAKRIHTTTMVAAIGLSGGVFQNRRLCESVLDLGANLNCPIQIHEIIPSNDGGIAYGQIIESFYRSG